MRILLIFLVGSILYFAIAMYFYMARSMRVSKYGRAVFKLSYDKYKKGINDKKEIQMNVTPFKEKNKVYLPLRYVANSLGVKNFEKDKDNKIIINYGDKKIKVRNDNKVMVKNKYDSRFQNIQDVKIKNDEFMVTVGSIRDMFDVDVDVNLEKNKVVIK